MKGKTLSTLLLIWSLCADDAGYQEYRKTTRAEIVNEDATTNTCLNNRLVKAHAAKDAKTIVYLVALYHEWSCELPEAAAKEMPTEIDAKTVGDLVRMVEKRIEAVNE
jgi:hypothetical protein